ncbi:MAG TPA: hypothetical protein VNJ53_07425 [Gaiellaceae bacterium]|nr:hypothetical protein [Gaiellaceae bacterium]
MRLLAPVLAAAALLAGASSARAAVSADYVYDRQLGVLAQAALARSLSTHTAAARGRVLRVYVRCYTSREAFEAAFERRFGVPARRVIAYYVRGGDVHLRNGTCARVREFAAGRHTVLTAAALAVLLHEALHRQGLRNERVTTCFANEAVRWAAEWLGFAPERALRARNLAFTYTRLYSPRAYFMGRPTCLALAERRSWRAFVRDLR